MTPTGPEILLLAARRALSPRQLSEFRNRATEVDDWTPILTSAVRHGTAGLLCHHLSNLEGAELAPEIREAAATFLAGQRRANGAALRQLLAVLQELGRHGVAVLPFKGPVVSETIYRDIGLRGFRDLDLLVHERDFSRTLQILKGLGYAMPSGRLKHWQLCALHAQARQDILYPEGDGAPLEPHFAFAQRALGLDLDAEGVFSRALEGRLGGAPVNLIAPEDQLLLLALHGSKERWTRLLWLVDLAEFLRGAPGVDWAAATARARSAGLERCLLLGAMLAADLLGAPVPENIQSTARSNEACLDLRMRVVRALTSDAEAADSWRDVKSFHWRLLETPRSRAAFLSGVVTEIRIEDFEAADLWRPLGWAYFGVKFARRVKSLSGSYMSRER